MVDGVRVIPLKRFEDGRGWFTELMRGSELPQPVRQSNLVFSRQGVIRGLHYHERGQCDLFACLEGMVRVVILDRESGETFTEDIGDENPAAGAAVEPRLLAAGRHPRAALPRARPVRPLRVPGGNGARRGR